MRTFPADITAAIESGKRQTPELGYPTYGDGLFASQITGMKMVESISKSTTPLEIGTYSPPSATITAVPGAYPNNLAAVISNAQAANPRVYSVMASYPGTDSFSYAGFVFTPDDTLHETATLEGHNKYYKFLSLLLCQKRAASTHDLQSIIRGITQLDDIVLPHNYTYGSLFSDIPDVLENGTLSQVEMLCHVAQACGRFIQNAEFFMYDKTQTPAVIPTSKIMSLQCARMDKIVKGVEVFDTSNNVYSRGVTNSDWRENYVKMTVKDNPLITSLIGANVCDNIYADWRDFAYAPYRLTMPHDPRIEVGDRIQFTDYSGTVRTSYAAEITRQFNGAMTLSMGM